MKLEPANSDEEPEAAAEAAAPVAVADTAAVAVVEPTPLVKAPATPSAPDPETSRSASSPTLSPTSPAFPELETGGDQDDNDDDCRRRQRRRMAPEAVQGNLLNVLESMTAAIAEAKEKAAAATSSTSDLAIEFAEVLDTFLLCMDQMDNVLTGGVIIDRSRHQRLREEKAAMELQSDMLAALSELKHYKGSKGAFVQVAITNVLDRRIRCGQTTKGHWLRMIMPLSEARAFLGESVLGNGRLEANAASVNLHSWWKLSVANGNATFTPGLNLRITHGVVQVNVNGFELSPDALAGVRMHQFRVFRSAAISRGAVTSRGHDRAQPADSGSRGSGSGGVGTAASASNDDDDDAKGFAAIVERALLAHARSQLLRPKLAALPWHIAKFTDTPVILWAQFACAGTPSASAASGTGGSAGSLGSGIGQWWQPSHWHWLGWPHWQPQPDTTEQSHWQWQWPWQP